MSAGFKPAVERMVLACVPVTIEQAVGAEEIASEAEISATTARKYLYALVGAGDVLAIGGAPVRYCVTEQGDRRARREVWESEAARAGRLGIASSGAHASPARA